MQYPYINHLKVMVQELEQIHDELQNHSVNGTWVGDYSGNALNAVQDLLYWAEQLKATDDTIS